MKTILITVVLALLCVFNASGKKIDNARLIELLEDVIAQKRQEDNTIDLNDDEDEDDEDAGEDLKEMSDLKKDPLFLGRLIRRIRIPWLPKVNLRCTGLCTSYNWCRAKNIFKSTTCHEPSGCNCQQFAWQGKK